MSAGRVAFRDPRAAGISGDMFLGALLDLSGEEGILERVAEAVAGASDRFRRVGVSTARVVRSGLSATRVEVDCDWDARPVPPEEILGEAARAARGVGLSEGARSLAVRVVEILASAESAVHGPGAHLHELASADTLVDAVGAAALMESLGILPGEAEIVSAPPALGSGFAETDHGRVPVPAPATLEIASRAGMPVTGSPAAGELTTPTGAAILAAASARFSWSLPDMVVGGAGRGAGAREIPGIPNVLTVVVGSPHPHPGEGARRLAELATHVDDVPGEILGAAISRLLEEGALDVAAVPTVTKTGRPGHLILVLVDWDRRLDMASALMRETGSAGVRIREVGRVAAERSTGEVAVPVGGREFRVRLKELRVPGGGVRLKSEYEDVVSLSREAGISPREAYDLVSRAIAGARAGEVEGGG